MSLARIILTGTFVLFGLIGTIGFFKKLTHKSGGPKEAAIMPQAPVEKRRAPPQARPVEIEKTAVKQAPVIPVTLGEDLPNVDRLFELFTTGPKKLPIVETVTYTSNVSWLKGRPAWIADYASHFGTSRHFIARSLNGRSDYFTQKILPGSRFNVFKKDKHLQFHLVIDVSRCKMGFYYVDLDTNERVLLKTYKVGLGKVDAEKPSGTLTPLGKYTLNDHVAIYQPGIMGYHQDRKVEMIQVFGTRWLPISELKGYGIQGLPWTQDPKTGELVEQRELIGKYNSDGCIRLAHEDIEELYAIVISKPTFVQIVRDFREAILPAVEVAVPR